MPFCKKLLKIAEINQDSSLSVRDGLDEETVLRYMAVYDQLPPVLVYHLPGGTYLLTDGFHRLEAGMRLGKTDINAEVREGTRLEAEEAAIVANIAHGRAYTRAQRREAACRMLRLHPERSDAWLARDLAMSANTIKAIRTELETTSQIDRLERLQGSDGKERPRELAPRERHIDPGWSAMESTVPPAEVTYLVANRGAVRIPLPDTPVLRTAEEIAAAFNRVATAQTDIELVVGRALDVLYALPDGAVDLAFVDLPFNLSKQFVRFGKPVLYDDLPPERYYALCGEWLAEIVRVLAAHGSLYLMTMVDHAARMRTILDQLAQFRDTIIWPNTSIPRRDTFTPSYQPILWYSKTQQFIYHHDADGERTKAVLPYGRKPQGHTMKNIWDDIPFVAAGALASAEAILVPGTKSKAHAAQMPIALPRRAILAGTEPGMLVADFFLGSGATALAALGEGRRFFGSDINPRCVRMGAGCVAQKDELLALYRKKQVVVAKPAVAAKQKETVTTKVPVIPESPHTEKQTFHCQWRVVQQDVRAWARGYTGPKFHALLGDVPYEQKFMGRKWDGSDISFDPATWEALSEHLLPGGIGIVSAGTRRWHRLACAIEDAGLVLHHTIFGWAYGSGYGGRGTRIDMQIDRDAGMLEQRRVVGRGHGTSLKHQNLLNKQQGYRPDGYYENHDGSFDITAPATELARIWEGHRYGILSLKPALEPMLVFHKPYEGRSVDSITQYGAGAMWIDGARIAGAKGDGCWGTRQVNCQGMLNASPGNGEYRTQQHPQGRWPANFYLGHHPQCRPVGTKKIKNGSGSVRGDEPSSPSKLVYGKTQRVSFARHGDADGWEVVSEWECHTDCPVRKLGAQSGTSLSSGGRAGHTGAYSGDTKPGFGDKGTAARYFFQTDWTAEVTQRLQQADPVLYCAKPSAKERHGMREMLYWRLLPDKQFERIDRAEFDRLCVKEKEQEKSLCAVGNIHVTLKPLKLCRWLATLLLPPAVYSPRRLLVPFAGAGSEMIGAGLAGWEEIVGVELLAEHTAIAEQRLKYWLEPLTE